MLVPSCPITSPLLGLRAKGTDGTMLVLRLLMGVSDEVLHLPPGNLLSSVLLSKLVNSPVCLHRGGSLRLQLWQPFCKSSCLNLPASFDCLFKADSLSSSLLRVFPATGKLIFPLLCLQPQWLGVIFFNFNENSSSIRDPGWELQSMIIPVKMTIVIITTISIIFIIIYEEIEAQRDCLASPRPRSP